MHPEIRPANISDAPFIADGNIRMALETEQRQLEPNTVAAGVMSALEDSSKGIYYIAEADGKPVGQMFITYEWSDWRNGNFWWIQSVYVVETFRGRGIFRALFEHVNALAKARADVCGLRLYVEAENAQAKQVYSRLGMNETEYDMFEIDFVLKHQARNDDE
jgi:GNAT superfamily N-acetyltransferase